MFKDRVAQRPSKSKKKYHTTVSVIQIYCICVRDTRFELQNTFSSSNMVALCVSMKEVFFFLFDVLLPYFLIYFKPGDGLRSNGMGNPRRAFQMCGIYMRNKLAK